MVRSNVVAAFAALTAGVAAEFRIVYGQDAAWGGGDQTTFDPAIWFRNGNADWSCDDLVNAKKILISGTNDATQTGGFTCDGCAAGEAIGDWKITRLEFEDSEEFPVTSRHPGMITLYPAAEEDVFDMVYFDGAGGEMIGSGGTCRQIRGDAQKLTCLGPGSKSGQHLFTCEGLDIV